jgi:SNF2 family DNA or RNA helicase
VNSIIKELIDELILKLEESKRSMKDAFVDINKTLSQSNDPDIIIK